MKITHDTNGNKVLKIESHDIQGKRGFSVQTLGNLPRTHRDGIGSYTYGELRNFIKEYGTNRQKELLGY